MLKANRILALIAIVICATQILSLLVHIVRPKEEAQKSPWTEVLSLKKNEIVRRTFVWYVGGLVFLGVAKLLTQVQVWLQLSLGIAGVSALLLGCAGGGFAGKEFLWPRFGLSILTLGILILISQRLSRANRQA